MDEQADYSARSLIQTLTFTEKSFNYPMSRKNNFKSIVEDKKSPDMHNITKYTMH